MLCALGFVYLFIGTLELYGRSAIRASKRISNPGCYSTCAQMLIAPLIQHVKPGALPTVFGISGYSGAGTVTAAEPGPDGRPVSAPKVTAESLAGGIKPYSLTDHIHEREAGYHLSRLLSNASLVKVAFIPSVAPWFSGIIAVASVPLKGRLTAREVVGLFEERYADDKLVKIGKQAPQVGDVQGQHTWSVGGFQVHSEGERVVVVVSFFLG